MSGSGKPTLIRAKGKEHTGRIIALINDIWPEHYTPIIGEAQVKYMLETYQSEAQITKEIQDGVEYYILSVNGSDAGYLALDNKKEAMYLSKLYVVNRLRNKGYGKFMNEFAEKRAAELGLTRIFLNVHKNNKNSIKAYEKMGYMKVREVIKDIGSGFIMDDYIMEKFI